MMFVGFLGCYGAIQESQCLLGTVRGHFSVYILDLTALYYNQCNVKVNANIRQGKTKDCRSQAKTLTSFWKIINKQTPGELATDFPLSDLKQSCLKCIGCGSEKISFIVRVREWLLTSSVPGRSPCQEQLLPPPPSIPRGLEHLSPPSIFAEGFPVFGTIWPN